MLSKNNFNEKIRQMDEKKDHFSIRKLTVGAASVLIGMTFIGLNGHTVYAADTTSNVQNANTTQSENKASDSADQSQKDITLKTKEQQPVTTLQTAQPTSNTDKSTTILPVKEDNKKDESKANSATTQDTTKVEAESSTKKTSNKDSKDDKNVDAQQVAEKAKQAPTDKKDAKVAAKQATPQYNVNDWDGSLNNDTHEYTLTGYHGEDKQNIYIPNTSDFSNAGKISDTDKVYITKDLINTISKAGATKIVIDSDGSDDKNKVYAKGDWSGAFANSSTLKSVDLSHLDTSEVTNMSSAFQNDTVLEDANLSGWDISNITNFTNMFWGDNLLSNVSLAGWDFSNNPTTSWMFAWTNIKKLDITDTKNINKDILVEYVNSFKKTNATSISLGGISISPNVTDISGLFYNMPHLEKVDLSGFDASHITNMTNLFYGDNNLTEVNLGNIDFKNIKTDYMFAYDVNIKNVNISKATNITSDILNEYVAALKKSNATSVSFAEINLSPNVTNLSGLFSNMPSLKHADLTGLNLNNVKNLSNLFLGDQNLESVNLSGLDFANTNTSGMFDWAGNSIKDVNITNTKNISKNILDEYILSQKNTHAKTIDLSNVSLSDDITSLSGLFSNMTDLESVNLTGLDTSHITDMSNMFFNTPKLTTIIGIENLDTHNVKNMGGMFESVVNINTNPQEFQSYNPNGSLTSLDLSNWDVSNVTNMSYMFAGQSQLTKLGDLSHWNTSKVTNMSGMFFILSNLPDDALQNLNWDTSQVTDMSYMFSRMNKQKDLSFVNNWNTSKVTDMSYMFFYDPALEKLDLSNWDTSSVGLKKDAQNYSLAVMFANDISLTSVGDLSHWNTSNVHDTREMFFDTPKLEHIDLSGWNTNKLEIAEGMFNYSGAKYIGLNNWDLSHIKHLNGNGLVNENGTLGGVENMFKNLYNNAVISMNNISLPDAKSAFVITDFAGTHPIVVIANGQNGEALPTLLAVNNQTWTDEKHNNVTGRQNSDVLTFVRADNDQELSQHGLNFIFTNLSDMQDYFNQETGINVVKGDLGDLVHDWNEKADTVDGHLKTANRVSPSASYDPYNNPNGIEDVVNGNTLASLMTSVYKLNIVSPKTTTQTKNPTRTIIIENPNGTTSTKTQSVEFTRTITKHADGTEQISDWTPAKSQWDSFDIPQINGYSSYVGQDQVSTIQAVNVDQATANVTITVSYISNGGNNNGGDDNTPVVPPVNPDIPRPLPEKSETPVTPNKPDDNSDYPKPHGEKTPNKETSHITEKTVEHSVAPKATQVSKENKGEHKDAENTLPQTGEKQNNLGILGLALMALSSLGFIDRKRRNK